MDEEETHVSKDGKYKDTRTLELKKLRCTPGKGTNAAERMDGRMCKVVVRCLGTNLATEVAASTKLTDAVPGNHSCLELAFKWLCRQPGDANFMQRTRCLIIS